MNIGYSGITIDSHNIINYLLFMIKFKYLTEEKLVSSKLSNGEFNYWLVIETVNFLNATGELIDGNKYAVAIQVVSPDQAGQVKLEQALDCVGYDRIARNELNELNDLVKVEALSDYGVSAQVWNKAGNNLNKLIRAAKKEAQIVNMLFGFYMDKSINMLGSTGWNFVKGEIF